MTPNPTVFVTLARRAYALALFCACFQATTLHAQSPSSGLSRVEQRIRDYVRAHQAEQVDFLEKAVNISSGTFNLAGVREVGRLFEPQFSAIGFQPTWVALPDAVGRAGHLFAERKGTKGKRLLLIGHLDTVFEGEGERFVRLDTLAAGAGSSDMKGGDVVILYALKALQSVGALDGTRIIVAFTGDEEDAGPLHLVSRRPLIDAAKRSDVALAFEEDAGKGTVARRGMSGWQLVVTGRQAPSWGTFSPGASYGAIHEAAGAPAEFREELPQARSPPFNPAVIIGGTDVTYDSAKISGTA